MVVIIKKNVEVIKKSLFKQIKSIGMFFLMKNVLGMEWKGYKVKIIK